MNFHSIEASFFGEFGSVDVFGNDSGEFGDLKGPWGDVVDHLFSGKDLSFGSDGRGGNRKNAVGLKAGMGDATDVPELKKNSAPCGMNGLDNFSPPGDLFGGVDSGGFGVAVAERGDGGCFSNDQSRGGSLPIVLGIQFIGDVACRGSAPSEWSHQDPMGKVKGSKLKGGEKGRHDESVESSRLWKPATLTNTELENQELRSKRSRFITLLHAAAKSFTNFSFASSCA